MIEAFRTAIIDRDEARFNALFLHDHPIWQNVSSDAGLQAARQKNPQALKVRIDAESNPRRFIQGIATSKRRIEEKFRNVRIDTDDPKDLVAHIERQDLDEIMGNLIENAAKYGGGSVFVTVSAQAGFVEIMIEDDGVGIPEADRIRIFDRGVRLDIGKPGTGLGLAIVRDVAEIYDGTVSLEESEDLGGLLVRLRLPAAG